MLYQLSYARERGQGTTPRRCCQSRKASEPCGSPDRRVREPASPPCFWSDTALLKKPAERQSQLIEFL